jgi:hypothetical protein
LLLCAAYYVRSSELIVQRMWLYCFLLPVVEHAAEW